ncbi:hypothetical protein V1477_003262 [Vespula maculifrons]|uniref:Uncharacterized protein n=2 Tax=Vespula TaxID=7451 RepID=A0A834MS17_VESVU|nr:hypothetical protein HZH66_013953 [Vespula vulgaris]
MTKSKRQNSLSKYAENDKKQIGRHWNQRSTIFDLVYKYLSKIADNYTKQQHHNSAYNQFRRKNRRKRTIRKSYFMHIHENR